MSRLIESIKCIDGELVNVDYHNVRFNTARKELFGIETSIDLNDKISIPGHALKGIFKCRIIYDETIKSIEFIEHRYRKIKSLKLIENDEIDYKYKFENRRILNNLFEDRGNCDDIIIVKNGYITDSFSANILFSDGRKWWTPETPLLPGTQRACLLNEGKIFQSQIKLTDMWQFKKVGLVNAMQDLYEMPVIPIKNIQNTNT